MWGWAAVLEHYDICHANNKQADVHTGAASAKCRNANRIRTSPMFSLSSLLRDSTLVWHSTFWDTFQVSKRERERGAVRVGDALVVESLTGGLAQTPITVDGKGG